MCPTSLQNGSLMARFAAPTCWNFYHIIRFAKDYCPPASQAAGQCEGRVSQVGAEGGKGGSFTFTKDYCPSASQTAGQCRRGEGPSVGHKGEGHPVGIRGGHLTLQLPVPPSPSAGPWLAVFTLPLPFRPACLPFRPAHCLQQHHGLDGRRLRFQVFQHQHVPPRRAGGALRHGHARCG